jgi:hypothetical protein
VARASTLSTNAEVEAPENPGPSARVTRSSHNWFVMQCIIDTSEAVRAKAKTSIRKNHEGCSPKFWVQMHILLKRFEDVVQPIRISRFLSRRKDPVILKSQRYRMGKYPIRQYTR